MKVSILILFLTSLLFLASCGQEVDCEDKPEDKACSDITELDRIGFFKIVYETVAVRGFADNTWTAPILGTRELKFDTTTTVADEAQLPEELEGSFVFNLNNYRRSTSQVACSGGYSGVFILTLSSDGEETELPDNSKPPYSILDSYSGTTIGAEADDDEVAEIRTYTFELGVVNEAIVPEESCSLVGSSNCDRFQNKCAALNSLNNCTSLTYCAWNEAARTCSTNLNLCQSIKVVRFENGQLVQDDYSKGSQFYYTPKLRTK